MNEYLPSITVQKGFFSNNFYKQKRYFSLGNTKKNLYPNYQFNKIKPNNSNIVNHNNFLIVSNTNKDEVNSIKNNTAITYYNRAFSDNKFTNNRNNVIPETFYKFQNNNNPKKNNLDNVILKNYNKSILQDINNKINKNTSLRNCNLYLPEVQTESKINKLKKGNSLSVSNKENNSNNLNITNSLFNVKQIKINHKEMPKKYILNHEKLECKNINIHPLKGKDTLTAIGFLDNKKNKFSILKKNVNNLSTRKTVSCDKEKEKEPKNKNLTVLYTNIKSIKSFSNLNNINIDLNNNFGNFRNNINPNNKKNLQTNTKICPICHVEKELYKYSYHLSLHPSKILDWLYLGSYRNACDKQDIKNIGINYVLNCAGECRESFPPGIKYCHLKLNDSPNFRIIKYLDRASAFINQAQSENGIILVHCQLGISRSTTCVIAYFIKYLGYTAMSALNFIKKKRTQVMPNFGFLNQLMIYEKNNLGVEKK